MKIRREVRTQSRGERGQALALFAVALVVLLGIVALSVDGGNAYVQRRRMQYAADAAALAGARAIGYGANNAGIENAVRQYALVNGADTYTWTRLGTNRIRVTVSHTFPTYFARILDISTMTARAQAEADISGVSAMMGVMPIGVEVFPFVFGQSYTLWSRDSRIAPGNFGWLDWNGGSRSSMELAANICDPGRSGVQRVGSWVWGAPGVRASAPVRNCLNRWLGQVVVIVLYDSVTGRGANTRYHIAGFGAFVLEGYNFTGRNKYIRGRFERYVVSGGGGGPNFGLFTIRLGPN